MNEFYRELLWQRLLAIRWQPRDSRPLPGTLESSWLCFGVFCSWAPLERPLRCRKSSPKWLENNKKYHSKITNQMNTFYNRLRNLLDINAKWNQTYSSLLLDKPLVAVISWLLLWSLKFPTPPREMFFSLLFVAIINVDVVVVVDGMFFVKWVGSW